MRVALAWCAVAVAGCGSFEDPNIVLDLRVLGMTSTPPEQVLDIDFANPPAPVDVLAQLAPVEVCALIADPNFDRRLRWSMTACNPTLAGRCPESDPHTVIGTGVVDDPDTTMPEPRLCATLPADGNMLGLLLDFLSSDPFGGLGGVDLGVELRVGGEDADPALDQYAVKYVRVSPRNPITRQPNHNPFLTGIDAAVDGGLWGPFRTGRCVDESTPLIVAPSQKVRLTPTEPDGVREDYVVPTIDGRSRMFTESLTYQWVATAGSYSASDTGGPHDAFGNAAPLFSDWKAPRAADLAGPLDVSIWIIQRDERLGEQWTEACIHVEP